MYATNAGTVTDPRLISPKYMINRTSFRRGMRVLQLESAMFNWRSRHLILVLTLNYRPEFQHLVSLETIQSHRDQLLNNKRSNPLLSGIKGYVWKIEQGQHGGGLHLHVILFYDGKHHQDVGLSMSIGEYWVKVITQGMGGYWNSNGDKDWHETDGHGIGVGQIDRHDSVKRDALRKNLLYLAKDEQVVDQAVNSDSRMFGTSSLYPWPLKRPSYRPVAE